MAAPCFDFVRAAASNVATVHAEGASAAAACGMDQRVVGAAWSKGQGVALAFCIEMQQAELEFAVCDPFL
jgi:hypothetical protein